VETFEVATFIQEIEGFFYELTGEMLDILVAVETQISRTEIAICNFISGLNVSKKHYFLKLISI
jgi:hypothetical protein